MYLQRKFKRLQKRKEEKEKRMKKKQDTKEMKYQNMTNIKI